MTFCGRITFTNTIIYAVDIARGLVIHKRIIINTYTHYKQVSGYYSSLETFNSSWHPFESKKY